MRYGWDTMLPERAFKSLGRKLLTLEGGGDPPPPPDYTPLAASMDKQVAAYQTAANNDLNFRMQQYNDSKPFMQEMQNNARALAQKEMAAYDRNQAFAQDQQNFYNQTFKPVEQQTVRDAIGTQWLNDQQRQQLDSALNDPNMTSQQRSGVIDNLTRAAQEGAANQAMNTAQSAQMDSQAQQARMLSRLGGDPNRMAALSAELSVNNAAQQAGAANTARMGAYQQGIGLRGAAASFGRNMPSTSFAGQGLATSQGGSGMSAYNNSVNAGLPMAQFAAGGYSSQMGAANMGLQGAGMQANMLNQGYQNQMSGYQAQQANNAAMWGAIGQAGGAGAGLYMMKK